MKQGSLGDLNPTPWAVMTGNCTGWIVYSFLLKVLCNNFLFDYSISIHLDTLEYLTDLSCYAHCRTGSYFGRTHRA